MIRAAIYARVSTDQQAQEGDSIPAQIDALTRYVNERQDMVLAGEYIDEGISGRKADRDELNRLLDDVKAGKIDRICFTKLDRWFRSVRHYCNTQEILDKAGVTWMAIWEPIYDTSTAAGRLIINQMLAIGQFEAENTSQRIRAVMEYKVAQGEAVTGKCPIGYRIKDKHLVIDEEGAVIPRLAFDTYSTTGSLGETARVLQAHGFDLHKQNVKYMLKNRKYIGEHRSNQAYCPPIIDKALFDDVQRKLSMNVAISTKRVHIFTGILKCGCCGRRMASAFNAKKTKHGYPYYRCHGYYVPPRICVNRAVIGERSLEAYLIDQLPKIATDAVVTEERQSVDTSKQVAALDRKIARLKDLYLAELITLDEYKKDKEDFEDQRAALLAMSEPPQKDLSALKDFLSIKDLRGLIEALTPQERQYFWRGVIREILFFPDRHIEVRV